MATLEEVKAAKPVALKLLEEMGVMAAVGITQAGLRQRLRSGERVKPTTEDPTLATDYVLSVHLQKETSQQLPKTIQGISAEYLFIGIPTVR